MQRFEVDNELILLARKILGISSMFVFLEDEQLDQLIKLAGEVQVFEDGEQVIGAGSDPEFFLVIVKGEISVVIGDESNPIEIIRLRQGQLVGETAIIHDETHSYACFARGRLAAVSFNAKLFYSRILTAPHINIPYLQPVSMKMKQSEGFATYLENRKQLPTLDPAIVNFFPAEFSRRHRLLPIKKFEDQLVLAYTGLLTHESISSANRFFAEKVEVRPVYFDPEYFNRMVSVCLGGDQADQPEAFGSGTAHIDELLWRLVESNGSDLYLSAGQIPRWRIDGDIFELPDTGRFGSEEVLELLQSVARPEILASFADSCDEDFAYSTSDGCRFRVNLLRDHNGVSAVFRHIRGEIRTVETLGLPKILTDFCTQPKGLVLVTGPTGCGKSTTLSAMIDWINERRQCHILTIEDPIEFIHSSRKALINQREVGIHTRSFAKALRAGLRENPDVVMVGEIRDNETMAMALETANTGHLVFATLHTATAASTIDRVIDNFPPESQNQIRMFLADNLIGVVCQTLCRRITGGSVPAFEIMVMDPAMANLIRTSKTYMLPNAMITSQAKGNRLLNDDLCHLVKEKIISFEEAMSKSRDRAELERKLVDQGYFDRKS